MADKELSTRSAVICVILCEKGLECVVTQTIAALEPNICELKIVVIAVMNIRCV